MELQVGVKALLKNNDGKYLLLKRSPEKYPEVSEKEQWDIPGGRINIGSPLLDNLKREIKEEISLDLIGEPQLITAQDILRIPGRHVVRLTYVGLVNGNPKLSEDHSEFRWFTREELENLEDLDEYLKELLKNGDL
ncbi:MAG: NUDIX domain-containing protein [Candidatus Colwellbacteria bacterium]|nr:NUDIX domain-containing protein [Candidatus Colwellbacteria bacterium]